MDNSLNRLNYRNNLQTSPPRDVLESKFRRSPHSSSSKQAVAHFVEKHGDRKATYTSHGKMLKLCDQMFRRTKRIGPNDASHIMGRPVGSRFYCVQQQLVRIMNG